MNNLPDTTSQAEYNLAYPLDTFYARAGRPLPTIERVSAADVPEPYRRLLAGEHDMTPTLEAFHGSTLGIRLLERAVTHGNYSRLVVLVTPEGTPVEFGAIVIYLDRLPPEGRETVLDGRTPLGTVLARYRVAHASCPQAFVRVLPDDLMTETFDLSDDRPLYGRRNVLLTADHRVLADILEILPPSSAGE